MARHLEETDIPIEYKGMKYNISPSALRSNNLTVELPEVKVSGKRKNKGYKSAFDPNGAGEFAATMMNSPLQLADYAVNRFIDASKGEHGKTDYRYTPVQTTMRRIGETLSPTRWIGTLKTGFKESPWSEDNPGLIGNSYLDMILDGFIAPRIANKTVKSYIPKTISYIKNSNPKIGDWSLKIPEDPSKAYRIMGPYEAKWLEEGNELSLHDTNPNYMDFAEKQSQIKVGNHKFSFFKAAQEHGGRKQFAKGKPWGSTTTTNGVRHYLAIPGDNLPWISGRHYRGPEGAGFKAGKINFKDAPIGSHIDIKANDNGYTGIIPKNMSGSVIYYPNKIFGKDFGYIRHTLN